MVGGNNEVPKKNTKPRKPTSLNVTRTNEFLTTLASQYGKYLTISGGAFYKGSRHKIDFRCELCGHVSQVKPQTMLSGSGCRKCRTTSADILDMISHMEELKVRRKFRLAIPPTHFTRKSKYSYLCNTCNAAHLIRPSEVVDENFACTKCSIDSKRGKLLRMYESRLAMLYAERDEIKCIDPYSGTQSMYHMCGRQHVWEATVVEMLTGMGCPQCKRSVDVRHLEPAVIYNKRYVLRNTLERKAIRAIKDYAGSLSRVHSTFSYPIPPTYHSHIAAFYIEGKKTLVDVVRFEKVKASTGKLTKSYKRAVELGFHYIVVTVRDEVVSGKKRVAYEILSGEALKRMRKDWLAQKKAKLEVA